MKILAFESTCDETAVAVVEDGRHILTDQIFSQAQLHAVYGGVVPEIASRCHVESISLLAQRAIEAAGITRGDEVIVPTLTFIAAVNPLTRYVGAEPIFIGCDDSLCIDGEHSILAVHSCYMLLMVDIHNHGI